MPADTAEMTPNNGADTPALPGRKLRRDTSREDNEGGVRPRLAKHGYIRFLTLRDLDGRSRAVAKANTIRTAFERDLGGDLTEGQNQLIQRATLLSVMLENFEVRYSLGEPIEFSDYMTGVNVLRRVLVTLGLERRARDVSTSSLNDYLQARAGETE